jgi:ubiquinol oxidase
VVAAVRLDEAKHRDVNHGFADDIAGRKSGQVPAIPERGDALQRLPEEKRTNN